jgi:mono/diheme cytochrome c family protein
MPRAVVACVRAVDFGARVVYGCAAAFNKGPQQTSKRTEPNKNNNRNMKKLIVFSVALLVAGAASVRAADAKENWEKNCAKCHGPDGKGKTKMGEKLGIKDYTDAKVQDTMKDDEMVKAIKEGVKDGEKTRMKAFGDALSDDEIKALVKHVRDFKK